MESDSKTSNKENCLSGDSYSDIDVDNVEKHKQLCIYKQELVYTKTIFLTILTMIKILYCFSIIQNKQNFIVWNENQGYLWSFQDI